VETAFGGCMESGPIGVVYVVTRSLFPFEDDAS